MANRLKFLLGSGFAVTFAVAVVPACSDDTSTRPLGGGSGTTGGTSSGSGGALGATGGNKAASGGTNNAASGGNKASGGTPNITPGAGGSKATGGTSNVGSGGANNNNNTGGNVNNNTGGNVSTGGTSNASGGASSGTGGGGSGGPAIGTGKCTSGAASGMSCTDFCMAWGANGTNCLSESTENLWTSDPACMTACQAFTEAQLCCRLAAITDGSPVLTLDHRSACEHASGRGCNMPVGDPGEQIPAMPAACGPYEGTPVANPDFPGGCPTPEQ